MKPRRSANQFLEKFRYTTPVVQNLLKNDGFFFTSVHFTDFHVVMKNQSLARGASLTAKWRDFDESLQ